MQEKQTPFAHYVQDALADVKSERAERASLGAGQPYNRQLP
jgi:ubiquinol-cytochrome c reductase subunit 7